MILAPVNFVRSKDRVLQVEKLMTSNPLIENTLLEVLSACLQLKVSSKQSGVRVPVLPAASTSFLSLLDVLFLNAALPHDLQNSWRQLFSTALHGESFSKLIGAITNQGPTLVIVKGKQFSLFQLSIHCRRQVLWSSSCLLFTMISIFFLSGFCFWIQHFQLFRNTTVHTM